MVMYMSPEEIDSKRNTLVFEADRFLLKNFNMELGVDLIISKRMRRTLGCFEHHNETPLAIIMSHDLIAYNSEELILDVLYHECVHYALFMKGEPSCDGDLHFKETLKRLGIGRTGTWTTKMRVRLYECKKCGDEIKTASQRLEKDYYSCRECGGSFKLIDTLIDKIT